MPLPMLTTREAAAVIGVSRVTACEYLRVWAALTQNRGCKGAGAGCRCDAWPHAIDGVTGPRGGKPGFAVDAVRLRTWADERRALAALDAELAREAA